jgi:hypothetical protein
LLSGYPLVFIDGTLGSINAWHRVLGVRGSKVVDMHGHLGTKEVAL